MIVVAGIGSTENTAQMQASTRPAMAQRRAVFEGRDSDVATGPPCSSATANVSPNQPQYLRTSGL